MLPSSLLVAAPSTSCTRQAATELVPTTGGASVILWDEVTQTFTTSASTVPNQEKEMSARRVRRQGGACRWVVDDAEAVVVPDTRQDPFEAKIEAGKLVLHREPFLLRDNVGGVLKPVKTSVTSKFSVWDRERLFRELDGDTEVLRRMARLFSKTTPDLISQIRTAITAQDAGAVGNAAHELKGSAIQLEEAARRRDLSVAAAKLERLTACLARMEQELNQLINTQ